MLTKATVMDRMDARFIFGGGITSISNETIPNNVRKKIFERFVKGDRVLMPE